MREVAGDVLTVYSAAAAAEAVAEFEARLLTLVTDEEEAAVPKTEKTTTVMGCDNPACPGTDLKKNDPAGWLIVNTEVVGQSTSQGVFCSFDCLGAASDTLAPQPETTSA